MIFSEDPKNFAEIYKKIYVDFSIFMEIKYFPQEIQFQAPWIRDPRENGSLWFKF
jgi:hypothetical protein